MKRKTLRIVTFLIAIFTLMFCLNIQVFAENIEIENFEQEYNDDYENANVIQVGNVIVGEINPSNDQDHFLFTGAGRTYNFLFLKQSNDSTEYVAMIYDHTTNTYVMPLMETNGQDTITYSFESEWSHVYELVIGAYSQSQRMYQFLVY